MKRLACILLLTLCLALIFHYNSNIDIFTSKLFFSATDNDFFLKKNPALLIIDELAYLIAFLLPSFNVMLILKKFFKTHSLNCKLYKKEAFVLLVFLLGNTMLVQGFSKHYFSRARPFQVEEFGGKLSFAPAFQVSKQCKLNCSFVSFHASIGILLIACAMATRKRTLLTTLGILLTLLFGMTRIIQGKHFLSDIIFSICFMLITTYTLFLLLKMDTEHSNESSSI